MRGRRPKGPVVEGVVRNVAPGGDGVVETPGGLVFVPAVWQGERVRIRVDAERSRGVQRGAVVEVLTPTPGRVEARCPHADRCGGCPWMTLEATSQRAEKARWVAAATGLEVTVEPAGPPFGYRRRARLHFIGNKALGYLPRRGRGVTDIAACVVLADPIAAAMDRVRADVLPGLVGQGEVNLALGAAGKPLVGIVSEEPQPPGVYSTLEAMVKSGVCVGATLRAGGASEPARWGDTDEVAPDDQLAIRGPFPGFSQANDAVNARLREVVAEWAAAEGAHVLELYAGHGNLTLALAPGAASVRAVEMSEEAARFGTANARAAGFDHVTFIPGDVAKHIKGPADIVVLDPPRTGAKDVMAAILALRPRRIVYVSCDVATLGRDLATLREGGYAPTRARAFDMFPQTAHVESVVLAEPVGGG